MIKLEFDKLFEVMNQIFVNMEVTMNLIKF